MRPVVFVDMDETLLHYDIYDGTTEVRPGAFEALREMRKFADVFVLSAGYPAYVDARLTDTGMLDCVDGVFSTYTYPTGKWIGDRRWVLLDNDTFLAEMKCEMIEPHGPSRWIQVETFDGEQATVTPLTAYVGAARRVLAQGT